MLRIGFVLLLLSLTVAGCDEAKNRLGIQFSSDAIAECRVDVAEWREEVRLHDGQVVQVWRRATACAGGFPNASRGRNLAFEFKYEPLGAYWKGLPDRDPVSFEIFGGIAYLVLYINDRKSCVGQPPSRYLAQVIKWEGGQWIEVNQADFPYDVALLNLHADYWAHTVKNDAKGLITLAGKYTGGRKKDTIKAYIERGGRFCAFYQQQG